MRTVHQWFDLYGDSHQNPTNKLIHWICVPAILFSIVGLLWFLAPVLAVTAMVISLWFYYRLSKPLSMAMAVLYGIAVAISVMAGEHLMPVSLTVFIVAWVFQFIGHRIEGKKPSFFEDVQFLLIGPLWCLGFLFRKLRLPY